MNYAYQQINEGEKKNHEEKPVKYNDHAADALRYLIMYLPEHWDELHHSNKYDLTPAQQKLISRSKNVFTWGEI